MRGSAFLVIATLFASAAFPVFPACAGESAAYDTSEFISNPGTVAIASTAVILPLFADGDAGKDRALRTADALVCATLVTEVLKRVIHERRPDGNGNDSMPSEHAALAFAAATMAADDHPEQAPYWYGAAAAVAYSRVRLKRHRPREVIAGALIGFGMAKLEQSLPRGLLLSPFIDSDGAGVEAVWVF